VPDNAIAHSKLRCKQLEIGRIRAFDKFTVLLDTHHGDQIIFKHAISTVGPARAAVEEETARETPIA